MGDFNQGFKLSRTLASDFGSGVVTPYSAVRGIFLISMGMLRILMIVAWPDESTTFRDKETEQGSLATFFS